MPPLSLFKPQRLSASARQSRAKHARLAPALLCAAWLGGCGGPPPVAPELSTKVLDDDSVTVAVVHRADSAPIVELRANDGTGGSPVPIARLRGARIVRDGAAATLLPFGEPIAKTVGGRPALEMVCVGATDHEVSVQLRLGAPGEVLVTVRDAIALRSRLAELTLDYEFVGTGPIEELARIHAHEADDELVGDLAFGSPIAFLRSGTTALGLVPDLDSLGSQRRLPQGIEVRPAHRTLRHGLIAHRVVTGAGLARRFSRREASPLSLRAESVTFGHSLSVTADATPHATLAQIQRRLWQRTGATRIDRSTAPLQGWSWHAVSARQVEQILLSLAQPRFDVRNNSLRAAVAALHAASFAEPDAATRLREAAVECVELALSAPRRSGMLPNHFVDNAAGERTWHPAATDSPEPGAFHVLDAACSGLWLLELSERLPELRPRILAMCRELARFLIQNQQAGGGIPAFFDAEFLVPRRGVFAQGATESGGPALFLAAFARHADDDEALRAARAAVIAIDKLVMSQPDRALADFECVSINASRGSLGLLFAARAAFELVMHDAGADADARAVGERLCDVLAAAQCVWSPVWLRDDATGGWRRTDGDLVAADPRTALAAEAMLLSGSWTHRADHLERGALALRAAFATPRGHSPRDGDGGPFGDGEAAPRWEGGTATAVLARVSRRLGQAHVDLVAGRATGLDAVWFDGLVIGPGSVKFNLVAHSAPREPVRVTFRVPQPTPPVTVTANGVELGVFDSARLRAGISVVPLLVPRVAFDPPAAVQHATPWEPRVRVDHAPSTAPQTTPAAVPNAPRTTIVYRAAASTDAIPARVNLVAVEGERPSTDTEILAPRPPDIAMGFEVGTILEVYAERVEANGVTQRVPPRGVERIRVEAADCTDPGDDDEHRLVDAGPSFVVRTPDGRERGRALRSTGASMTYALPIPSRSTSVEIRLAVHGRVRLSALSTSDGELQITELHADEADHTSPFSIAPRVVRLEVADQRLWRTGHLNLHCTAADRRGCIVARIDTLATGDAASLGASTERDPTRRADPQIEVLVVPIAFSDLRPAHEPAQLARVFFGGDEYRLTPEPEPRLTSGSVARLVGQLSGGISRLHGSARDLVELPITHAEWDPAQFPEALARIVADAANSRELDAVVVIHPNATTVAASDQAPEGRRGIPIVHLSALSADGSILSSGTALLGLLDRLYDLLDMSAPEAGNLGAFALSAVHGGHAPPPLAGTNAARCGWAEIVRPQVDADLGLSRRVELAPIESSRQVLRLPCADVPDRPSLFVEAHTLENERPWRTPVGALLSWQFGPAAAPLVVDGTRQCRPHTLRLSPARPRARTPFYPATGADLFTAAENLDGLSQPSLATLHGDVFWALRDLRADEVSGGTRFVIEAMWRDLLTQTAAWRTGATADATAMGPLSASASDAGLGAVDTLDETGFRVAARTAVGSAVRATFALDRADAPRRILGRVRARGAGRGALQVTTTGTVVTGLSTDCREGEAIWFEIDLPPTPQHGPLLHVDFIRRSAGRLEFEFDRLIALPRVVGTQPLRLDSEATSIRLMDGIVRDRVDAVALDANGEVTVSVPLVIPPRQATLRVLAGLRTDVAAEVRIAAKLVGPDATLVDDLVIRHDGHSRRPLASWLIELPTGADRALRFLEFEITGPPGVEIGFPELAVDG